MLPVDKHLHIIKLRGHEIKSDSWIHLWWTFLVRIRTSPPGGQTRKWGWGGGTRQCHCIAAVVHFDGTSFAAALRGDELYS